jgi:probable rRNA maturation factor
VPVHLAVDIRAPRGFKASLVRRHAQRMLATLQIEKLELSILITGDEQIHILNRDYRKKNRPTDVLAFAMREGERSELAGDVLGDVVISVETAARQAADHGRSTQDEVTFLLAHGLLHLLGWDHDTPSKDRAMTRETERLCRAAAALERVSRPSRRGGDRMPKRKAAARGARAPRRRKSE